MVVFRSSQMPSRLQSIHPRLACDQVSFLSQSGYVLQRRLGLLVMDGAHGLKQDGIGSAENQSADRVDIMLLTDLHEELQWIQQVEGAVF